MAITQNTYTGNGSTVLYSFTFPYLDSADVKVTLNGTLTTAYTFANATTIQFTTAPGAGVAIRIYRETYNDETSATFFPGSSIKASDLNNNFTQTLYVVQEVVSRYISKLGDTMQGILNMGGNRVTNLSAPVNDGDAANKLYVDVKVGASGPPGYTNWSFIAFGGETTIGTSGPLLEYQVGKEQVYLNGALQKRNVDYTGNDGITLIFAVPLIADDNVQVRCVNYLAANPTASYNYSRWTKTIGVGGTSSLGGTLPSQLGDGSAVLSYTASRELVFVNGALLERGIDYTATNGTTISILGPILLNGDMIEVHSNNSI